MHDVKTMAAQAAETLPETQVRQAGQDAVKAAPGDAPQTATVPTTSVTLKNLQRWLDMCG
jgi:hypothetical protein